MAAAAELAAELLPEAVDVAEGAAELELESSSSSTLATRAPPDTALGDEPDLPLEAF